jgi:hypothetical protein
MQINFTPHKIKASKAYIENLVEDELKVNKLEKKKSKDSFFRKIWKLFYISNSSLN